MKSFIIGFSFLILLGSSSQSMTFVNNSSGTVEFRVFLKGDRGDLLVETISVPARGEVVKSVDKLGKRLFSVKATVPSYERELFCGEDEGDINNFTVIFPIKNQCYMRPY